LLQFREVVDHYGVLGVSYVASIDEIKKAYRALAFVLHPDVADLGEIPDAAERFKAVAFAYEVLSDDDKRRQLDLSLGVHAPVDDFWSMGHYSDPTPEPIPPNRTIYVDGISFKLIYKRNGYWSYRGFSETVQIRFQDVPRVGDQPTTKSHYATWEIIDDDGNQLAYAYSFDRLRFEYEAAAEKLRRLNRRRKYQAELDTIKLDRDRLTLRGVPVTQLVRIIHKCEEALARTEWAWHPLSFETVITRLREAHKEVERLDSAGPELLLNELMVGRVRHPDLAENGPVINAINAGSVRTNGYVSRFTPADLEAHYAGRLGDIVSVYDLNGLDLKLRLEDYAPAELMAELELAPECIEIKGRKNPVPYPVTYGLETIEGKETAIGIIQLPIGVFERNAVEYGKRSPLPVLPFDIVLIVEVTNDDKIIARGPNDESLAKRVTRYQRGDRRNGTDDFGFPRRGPFFAEPPPPWYMGSRPR
jgi:curved DNA-binding protein CbpA